MISPRLGVCSFALHSFAQNRSYLRATVSDSLMSIFKKEQPWGNRSRRSLIWATMSKSVLLLLYKRATMSKSISSLLKKSNMSDSLMVQENRSQKQRISFHLFLTVFHCFSPFLCPQVNCSHRTLLSRSFLKSDWVEL